MAGWQEPPQRLQERRRVLAAIPQILAGPDMAPPRGRPTGRPESKAQRLVHEIYRWTGGPTDAFKSDVRYISAGVHRRVGLVTVEHEHVWQVHKLRDRLLAGEKPSAVLADACACLVTPEEHKVLNKLRRFIGWERYAQAGIGVWDRMGGRWVDLPQASASRAVIDRSGGDELSAEVDPVVVELGGSPRVLYSMAEAKATLERYAFGTREVSHPSIGTIRIKRFGYATYDCVVPASGAPLHGVDIVIAAGLNARIDVGRAAAIAAVGEDVGKHIRALDDFATKAGGPEHFWDLNQEELDPQPDEGTLGWHLRKAWQSLINLDRVGVAITHKTLHHKRPHWFPLLDGKTRKAYARDRAWHGIHRDLTEQAEQFGELEEWFAQRASRERAEAVPLNRLRVHDILLWCGLTDNRVVV